MKLPLELKELQLLYSFLLKDNDGILLTFLNKLRDISINQLVYTANIDVGIYRGEVRVYELLLKCLDIQKLKGLIQEKSKEEYDE